LLGSDCVSSTEPWRGERFWVSPYNFADEVVKQFRFPEKIVIHDVTLRDGEQTRAWFSGQLKNLR
jgi:hypothetical protein